jgi:hypothetical protein
MGETGTVSVSNSYHPVKQGKAPAQATDVGCLRWCFSLFDKEIFKLDISTHLSDKNRQRQRLSLERWKYCNEKVST